MGFLGLPTLRNRKKGNSSQGEQVGAASVLDANTVKPGSPGRKEQSAVPTLLKAKEMASCLHSTEKAWVHPHRNSHSLYALA